MNGGLATLPQYKPFSQLCYIGADHGFTDGTTFTGQWYAGDGHLGPVRLQWGGGPLCPPKTSASLWVVACEMLCEVLCYARCCRFACEVLRLRVRGVACCLARLCVLPCDVLRFALRGFAVTLARCCAVAVARPPGKFAIA